MSIFCIFFKIIVKLLFVKLFSYQQYMDIIKIKFSTFLITYYSYCDILQVLLKFVDISKGCFISNENCIYCQTYSL